MSWRALLMKEWNSSSVTFSISFVCMIVFYVILYYLMGRYTPFLFSLAFLVILALLLSLALDWFSTLHKEWRENTVYTWLNLPIPGWKLLLSKLIVSFVQFIIHLSTALIGFYILIHRGRALFEQSGAGGLQQVQAMDLLTDTFAEHSAMFFIAIPYVALLLAFGVAFIFFMSKSVRRLGWLIGIGIVAVFYYVRLKIIDTEFFGVFTEWGLIRKLEVPEQVMFAVGPEQGIHVGEVFQYPLYLGNIVVGVGLLVGIFLVLSWLLDNKVQTG
ncbi:MULTISPECIES: hypothetical protein [Bacillaceae]|uniref:ABC-2 family transporter protein n=1 Tax=Evansella alkalicola TaxID=745819 RepID=A0ABS6JZ78_9BACI|nr:MULTISPECIES: hypothetical protein [Bacillaceae]MBU9723715.1 hypothetical protein [Bacillus alkalicola]